MNLDIQPSTADQILAFIIIETPAEAYLIRPESSLRSQRKQDHTKFGITIGPESSPFKLTINNDTSALLESFQ